MAKVLNKIKTTAVIMTSENGNNSFIVPNNVTNGLTIKDSTDVNYIEISTDVPEIKFLEKVTISDTIDMSGTTINNLGTPVADGDAITKLYSDTITDLNTLNLENHVSFMSGWVEYSSIVDTNVVIYTPTGIGTPLSTPGGELTEVTVSELGKYRVTFNAQYTITTGECECTMELNNLISALNANTFINHPLAEFGGQTLSPGYYDNIGAITHTGQLILDAGGGAGAADEVFIIRSGGALAVAASATIVLQGGAVSSNVFWIITGAITMGANIIMIGTYIAIIAAIGTAGVNLVLDGRFFTTGGAINFADITATAPTDTSIYTDNNILKNYVFYTAAGAISTTGYTLVGTTEWLILTELGVISGFGPPLDGTYPMSGSPLIHSDICICLGDSMIMPSTYHLLFDTIGENFNIGFGYTVNITTELEKKICMRTKVISNFGGINYGTRSLFAMPLVVL
jgi:hypothetical protein